MSALFDRIAWLGQQNKTKPHDDPSQDPQMYKTAHFQPLVRVQIFPNNILGYEDGYSDYDPLIAADGSPISSTGPRTWGQLWAAGTHKR